MLKGGCFCGAVRYEAEGEPFHETNCHCSICRRTRARKRGRESFPIPLEPLGRGD